MKESKPETGRFDTLYKYRAYSARALEMLIRRELYFASPAQLNDPHDCRLSIGDSLRSAIARTRKPGSGDLCEKLERLQKIDHVYEQMNHDLDEVGVLSLSRVSDSVLMWTHYSDNHKGFCVGFKLSETFTTHRNPHQIIGATDVGYLANNPFIDFFEEVAAADTPPPWEKFWRGLLSMGMAAKAKSWDYEKEVRILRKEPGAVPFEPSELTEIIFGLDMRSTQRDTLRKLLCGAEWSHVVFRQVTRSDGFALELRDANAT